MNKSLWIGIGIFIALAIGAGIFLSKSKENATSINKPTPTPTTTTSGGSPTTASNTKEVQVVASEYSFNPDSISLLKGDKVSLTFRNTGKLPHNLTIADLGVKTKTIPGGQSDTIEFTADTSGTFSFYCSISGHKALGMEGVLEVK